MVKFHRFKDLGLETALISDASHKIWVPRILTLLCNLATKSEVFHNPHPRLDNLLEWFRIQENTVLSNTVYYKDYWVWSLGREDPLEEGTAIHSSILAWRIPMDRGALAGYNPLQRVGHYWATKHSTMWTQNLKRKKNFLIFNVIKQKNIM